jgi:hypothetical protein
MGFGWLWYKGLNHKCVDGDCAALDYHLMQAGRARGGVGGAQKCRLEGGGYQQLWVCGLLPQGQCVVCGVRRFELTDASQASHATPTFLNPYACLDICLSC